MGRAPVANFCARIASEIPNESSFLLQTSPRRNFFLTSCLRITVTMLGGIFNSLEEGWGEEEEEEMESVLVWRKLGDISCCPQGEK